MGCWNMPVICVAAAAQGVTLTVGANVGGSTAVLLGGACPFAGARALPLVRPGCPKYWRTPVRRKEAM
jgi:hypothetical protein